MLSLALILALMALGTDRAQRLAHTIRRSR